MLKRGATRKPEKDNVQNQPHDEEIAASDSERTTVREASPAPSSAGKGRADDSAATSAMDTKPYKEADVNEDVKDLF